MNAISTGIRRFAGGALACRCMNCLTMRSSSEWKLITASRPPGFNRAIAASRPTSRSSSSRLMWMRMAWKVRVAGCAFLSLRGINLAINPASWAVRVNGSAARSCTIARAIRRDCFSSPQVHSTSAISFSSARASHSAALSPESGSMRMSSGPSLPNENPRSATSSCGDDTPRSNSTPSRPSPASDHPARSAKLPRCQDTRASAAANCSATAIASGSLSITSKRPPGPSRCNTPPACPPRPNVPSR